MTSEAKSRRFVPLSEFEPPPLPAEEVLRNLLGRVLALLQREQTKPFIADDRLSRATIETLDDVVAPPACGPLLAEIDATVGHWRERVSSGEAERRLVLVLPPCDASEVIETWARERGHRIVEPPPRSHLVSLARIDPPDLRGEELLVVPRLERWYLRQRNGMRRIRQLLAAIEASRTPVVVGCNSWAWRYLSRALAVDALLPDPVTFRAFDADRLRAWFSELGRDSETANLSFRLPDTGEDVLARDEEGRPASQFLDKLAGRSLGIPWVAWHLWRRSLRSETDPSVVGEAGDIVREGGERAGEQTLWVAALDEYVLPDAHERSALLILHALLLHGGLDVNELRLVLPTVGESHIMPVLAKAGFVERKDGAFRVRATAYPAVVGGLRKAGFPLDGMQA